MAPLRQLSFRLLLAGELISNFGDGIFQIALSWYVLRHGGALLLGTVLAAYGVPRTALLIVGGHASDRYRPWTVMLAANCARGLAVTGLAITATTGTARGLTLIVIAIVLGAGEGMFVPASEAIVPALVQKDQLQAGNALISGTTQLSQLAGPALGGLLVALAGPAQGFAIDAATFAVSALTLVGVRRDRPGSATAPNPGDPTTAPLTLRDVLGQPIVRLMLITDALVNLGSTGMGRVGLPSLAKGPMHLSASGYGALSAAMGAGLLLGTIIASSMPSVRRPFLVYTLALLPTVPLTAAVPFAGGVIATGVVLIFAFLLIAIGNLLLITGLQQWAPPDLLGRLTGVLMLASVGMMPLSTLIAGVVIRLTGPRTYFPLDAATVAVAAIAQLSSSTWRRFEPADGPTPRDQESLSIAARQRPT
ncbi:MAG: MFS transporter [Solirubrobacteraceae bacterium]